MKKKRVLNNLVTVMTAMLVTGPLLFILGIFLLAILTLDFRISELGFALLFLGLLLEKTISLFLIFKIIISKSIDEKSSKIMKLIFISSNYFKRKIIDMICVEK